jgi:hypothetical protein
MEGALSEIPAFPVLRPALSGFRPSPPGGALLFWAVNALMGSELGSAAYCEPKSY